MSNLIELLLWLAKKWDSVGQKKEPSIALVVALVVALMLGCVFVSLLAVLVKLLLR